MLFCLNRKLIQFVFATFSSYIWSFINQKINYEKRITSPHHRQFR